MKLVVFDFDKTLTDRDTLFGFYREIDGRTPTFLLKRIVLLGTALAYKAGLISNDRLKSVGVWLFLRGKTTEQVESAARSYARKITLNQIYEEYYRSLPRDERLIISASLTVYLQERFPGEHVIGSTLSFEDGVVNRLAVNMYGEEKLRSLVAKGVDQCSRLFTDSFSDRPLMDMAKEVFLVRDGLPVKIKE